MASEPSKAPNPDASGAADSSKGSSSSRSRSGDSTVSRRLLRPLPTPPEIPGYEVGEVIGRGAMGVVYRARQLIVDRDVALKVLHEHHSSQRRLIRRLQREARTTARLAHPHVVSAIDMGETEGAWWYAMELVDGPSLALRLRQETRLKEREALRLFIPLCEALEHLFEHGVVHRDIKPANILIDKAGGARLADLGLAFADDDPQMSGQGGTLGTPHYISPEQAIDSSTADVRSDIWSFGATLFHTVCGRPPFKGESAAEILSAVLYSRVPDPRDLEPTISRGLALVLRKCLTHEPERRYQTPRELLTDLERVRERRAPRVKRQRLDPVQRRGNVRRVGALIVVALAGTAMLFAFREELGFVGAARSEVSALAPEPNAELEAIASGLARLTSGETSTSDSLSLGSIRRELSDLRETLPSDYVTRWEEVDRALARELRRIVREEKTRTLVTIDAALDARDYTRAYAALFETFEKRVLDRTGCRLNELEADGVSVAAFIDFQSTRLTKDLDAAARVLQQGLEDWNAGVREEVDRLVARSDWKSAIELLVLDEEEILRASGFDDLRLPASFRGDAIEAGARLPLWHAREAVKDEWRALDRALASRVLVRAETLAEELESARPRIRAANALDKWFELELEGRGLTIESMPIGVRDFAVTCLDVLESKREELEEREAELLESDWRQEVEDTVSFCEPLWGTRHYARIHAHWSDMVESLASIETGPDARWREELERRAIRRREEAQLLVEMMREASNAVRDLDGKSIDEFTVGAIRYPNVRVRSGPDPLEDGFFIDEIGRRIDLRSLPFQQIVTLAGLEPLESLGSDRRLALAAFYYHEGAFERARATLRPELFAEGVLAELEADIEGRVFDSIESREQLREARTIAADDHLALVFDEELPPSNVLARIRILIDEYADIPSVQARIGDLRDLEAELRAGKQLSVLERIDAQFRPTALSAPGFRRARMEFLFQSSTVGAWQHGDWKPDGLGWTRGRSTSSWENFAEQGPARLILSEPLAPDSFELVLELDQSEGLPQLFLVSIAGFHVALSGPGLPGSNAQSRFLVGSGDLEEFVARVSRAEGTERPALLRARTSHTLRLVGYRPQGRLSVELDGELLGVVRGKGLKRETLPKLEIRAWDPIWLKKVTLETDTTGR